MPFVPVTFPIYVPRWLQPAARAMLHAYRDRILEKVNSWGDRDIEYSYIAGNLPPGPGAALDFGNGPGFMSILAAQRGFEVTGVDLLSHRIPWQSENVRFLIGDLLDLVLPFNHFDVVINCSTIEHVGLAGNYGIDRPQDDGDLKAMLRLCELMKPGGTMLLTIPVGQDAVFVPTFRVYGPERLPKLLGSFSIEKENFWIKNIANRWIPCDRQQAFSYQASAHRFDPVLSSFTLGCFVLRKPGL